MPVQLQSINLRWKSQIQKLVGHPGYVHPSHPRHLNQSHTNNAIVQDGNPYYSHDGNRHQPVSQSNVAGTASLSGNLRIFVSHPCQRRGRVHMGCNSSYIFYNSGLFPGFELKIVCFRMPLITHQVTSLLFLRAISISNSIFIKCSSHRLLNIYMLT